LQKLIGEVTLQRVNLNVHFSDSAHITFLLLFYLLVMIVFTRMKAICLS